MAVTGTDFVTIPITDFETSKAFYRDTLGLEEGKRWGEMPAQEFETGNLTIAIMDPTAFGQEYRPAGGSSVVLRRLTGSFRLSGAVSADQLSQLTPRPEDQ